MDCFRRFLSHLRPENTVVVALSGGADSVCLCHRLWSLPGRSFSLLAAHLNHGLRGEESDGDEAFVRALCENWGIPLRVKRLLPGQLAAQKGRSLEEAGRQARYAWFEGLLEEDANRVLVTAHTASDQGETVLFFMSRGSSLKGLGGIPFRRGRIYRPLLDVTGAAVRDYCARQGLAYREDSSNRSLDYTRNQLRSQVMPVLRRINPKADSALARLARDCREDEDCLTGLARQALESARQGEGYSAKALANLHPALQRRAAVVLLKRQGLTVTHREVEEMVKLFSQGGEFSRRGKGYCAGQGMLAPLPQSAAEWPGFPLKPGRFQGPGGNWFEIQKIDIDSPQKLYTFSRFRLALFLDCGKISKDAGFRTRQPGDVLSLSGRKGTKSLKKWFEEAKVPAWQRQRRWILADGFGAAAAEGLGVDRRVAPDASTRQVWAIRPLQEGE